jgi:N-acetylmuramoyl-L-alanine amidase
MHEPPARRLRTGCALSAGRVLTFIVGISAFPVVGVFGADAPRMCSGGRLRVAVDIGHSRAHPGATSARRAPEYSFNARFAKELVAKSKHASPPGSSLDLFIHNPDGAEVDLYSRPRNARRMGAQVFISIHHDSVQARHLIWRAVDGVSAQQTPTIRGYSIFVSRRNPYFDESRRLGWLMGRSFTIAQMKPTAHHAEDISGERRKLLDPEVGLYEAPFVVIASATIPAVLVEVGVIANAAEEHELNRPEYRARAQLAILEALSAFCAGQHARERPD